jgi:small subunit ribosomal protein S9
MIKFSSSSIFKRKQATAHITVTAGNGLFYINNKFINIYFLNNLFLLNKITQLFKFLNLKSHYNIFVTVNGGGLESQCKAILLGVSHIFSSFNYIIREKLQKLNFLHRDLRIKERKKYGLRKARKAPQYSKR